MTQLLLPSACLMLTMPDGQGAAWAAGLTPRALPDTTLNVSSHTPSCASGPMEVSPQLPTELSWNQRVRMVPGAVPGVTMMPQPWLPPPLSLQPHRRQAQGQGSWACCRREGMVREENSGHCSKGGPTARGSCHCSKGGPKARGHTHAWFTSAFRMLEKRKALLLSTRAAWANAGRGPGPPMAAAAQRGDGWRE